MYSYKVFYIIIPSKRKNASVRFQEEKIFKKNSDRIRINKEQANSIVEF